MLVVAFINTPTIKLHDVVDDVVVISCY